MAGSAEETEFTAEELARGQRVTDYYLNLDETDPANQPTDDETKHIFFGRPAVDGLTEVAFEDSGVQNIALARPLDGLFVDDLKYDAADRLGIGLAGVSQAVDRIREQRQKTNG